MKEKMRAAVFEKVGVLTVKEVDVPKIEKPDHVILEVEVCSICGSDVHIMADPPGFIAVPGTILGHEVVGKIVDIGPAVQGLKVGDRVVLNPNDYCGHCAYCKKNLPNFCEHLEAMGIAMNGGFAEYVRITEKVAYKIDPDLPAEIAAYAEPLACFLNGKNKIAVTPGDSVVIIGGGPIGQLAIQVLKMAGGIPVIVSEPVEARRKMALENGADYAINPLEEDLVEFVKSKTGGLGADYSIDLVGSQIGAGISVLRNGGTLLIFGLNSHAEARLHQFDITTREIRVQGTWLANASFPIAVKLLESGRLNLQSMITHRLPLEQVAEGINILRRGEGIEMLIDPKL